MSADFETISNRKLILDNLRHIELELGVESPSAFRIAREAHQLLLRAMIGALRGTDGSAIIKPEKQSETKELSYEFQGGARMSIEKDRREIPGCKKAWRYTPPAPVENPPAEALTPTTRTRKEASEEVLSIVRRGMTADLRGFYDLLARIQTEWFMQTRAHCDPVSVTDEEMSLLEWLHEEVRNEFEHFRPQIYNVDVESSVTAASTCLKLTDNIVSASICTEFRFMPYDWAHNSDEASEIIESSDMQCQKSVVLQKIRELRDRVASLLPTRKETNANDVHSD